MAHFYSEMTTFPPSESVEKRLAVDEQAIENSCRPGQALLAVNAHTKGSSASDKAHISSGALGAVRCCCGPSVQSFLLLLFSVAIPGGVDWVAFTILTA